MFPGVCQSASTVSTRAAPLGAQYCPDTFLVEQRGAVRGQDSAVKTSLESACSAAPRASGQRRGRVRQNGGAVWAGAASLDGSGAPSLLV